VIYDSPSYIYNFALPICPPSSWLHQHYSTELSQEVKIIKGISAGWGTCFRTVLLDEKLLVLACWKDTIAVGLESGPIIILNAITGMQVAILSGHSGWVGCLVFSTDGTSLISGSEDKTIKLWDMQTGGVVRTFHGHTYLVSAVSISADCVTIASGSWDGTICVWDVRTGECNHIIKQENRIKHVCFFPLNPKHLIFISMSISGDEIWQWDISSQQFVLICNGSQIAFSLDGTQFVVCNESLLRF